MDVAAGGGGGKDECERLAQEPIPQRSKSQAGSAPALTLHSAQTREVTMGFFDAIKGAVNAATGGGAKVAIEFSPDVVAAGVSCDDGRH